MRGQKREGELEFHSIYQTFGGYFIVIVIYPHFQAPELYIHNYDTIYTGLLQIISLLLYVYICIDKFM